MKKLLIYAVLVGILAGAVTLVTDILQGAGFISTAAGLTFVTFACWASYFLFGADPKAALKGGVSMIVGIICAIIIYVLTNAFAGLGWNVGYAALPVAVIIGVILMCAAEKLPYANNVAAIFMGAALYFAIMGTPAAEGGYALVAAGELVYGALGLFSGYLTIMISKKVRN
ncbi:MAG: DUF1097 domain-containing protein [Lachnospiraceae bacterium]|jgi:hypothetical protein|nr:DUF1097 domain-containing protein [Lachnospiraceae bacterium]